MKHTHIALVGGQAMPVYQGIIEMQPDGIVLVHSESTKKQAEQIAHEKQDMTTLRCLPPVDMRQIKEAVGRMLDEFAQDDVTINVTSGTKPWALAFTMLTQGRDNCRLIYIDQNGTFYDYTHDKAWQPQTALGMEQLMRFNGGQTPKSHTLLTDYTDEDVKTLQQIKSIRRKHQRKFNELTIPNKSWKQLLDGGNEGKHDGSDKISYVQWKKTERWVNMYISDRWRDTEQLFESPHAVNLVFNSGWFEYEVAKMLSEWKYAREVWVNVIFPYREGLAKNEIDVVVNIGSKLLMVECKTQIFDNTDIDKFSSAVKNYGGMGCKALFVTESCMKNMAKEKCSDNHILSFSLSDYTKEIKTYAGKTSWGIDYKKAKAALFALLDKEIININAR